MLVIIIICLALRAWPSGFKDGLCPKDLKLDVLLVSLCGSGFLDLQTVLELALSLSFQLSFI